jgi:hypothetical protein
MPIDIPSLRLANQRLAHSSFQKPAEAVGWLGAVQAQDYAGAKWALGLRLPGNTEAGIERACEAGAILRTHVLRPTWHFVTPADIRWLLALTAPRVHAFNATYYRKMELDGRIFTRCNAALEKALRDGKQLTRPELEKVLQQAGIATHDLRSTLLIMHAELDGLLCSGARRGRQFTYALLEERVPPARSLERNEALAELALRYFSSHGPASVADFTWWSGLTTADALAGLESLKSRLQQADLGGRTCYWSAAPGTPAEPADSPAFLLPNYDEYTVAYADRSAISVGIDLKAIDGRTEGLLTNTIVLDGQVAGTWRRTITKKAVEIELRPYGPLSETGMQAIHRAARRYAAFLGLPLLL